MPGLSADTLRTMGQIDHIIQSVQTIMSTALGERVMREWVGNPGTRLLGENLTQDTIMRWWTVTWALLLIFEPRIRIKTFQPTRADRSGALEAVMVVEYRPYAHLNFVQARLYVSLDGGSVSIREAS